MADGGEGSWKYTTRLKGTDEERGRVQMWTVWSTPTKRMPVPRGTGGVWFVYERKENVERKIQSRSVLSTQAGIPSTTTSNGYWGGMEGNPSCPRNPSSARPSTHRTEIKSEFNRHNLLDDPTLSQQSLSSSTTPPTPPPQPSHPLHPIANLTYRFQHQHLSHTIPIPNDVYLLPITLPPSSLQKTLAECSSTPPPNASQSSSSLTSKSHRPWNQVISSLTVPRKPRTNSTVNGRTISSWRTKGRRRLWRIRGRRRLHPLWSWGKKQDIYDLYRLLQRVPRHIIHIEIRRNTTLRRIITANPYSTTVSLCTTRQLAL
ncbi:hypothetical protein BC829DRAFT_266256 [Chytridium lagenaria]|nr:hypothetical protein BC829DRAFT_266256 [Chytridium lagenaria]